MKEEVLNYINTERDISKYNILIMKRGELSPAKSRLIQIEHEFIEIPFERLGLLTVEKVAEAIDLYRQSRRLFYLKHDIKMTSGIAEKISKKISYLDRLSSELKSKRIKEINLIEDKTFRLEMIKHYSDKKGISLGESESILRAKTLMELQKIEPSIIAKKRARLQSALYSLGSYIQKFIDDDIDLEKQSNSDFYLVNSKIDSFIFEIENFVFEFYNSSLSKIPDKVAKTMGRNNFIEKIYSLENIFDLYKDTPACTHIHTVGKKTKIDLSSPKLGNIYSGYKNPIYSTYQKDSDRQSKNRPYGIIFPIDRVSREKMTPLHIQIYSSGINITELFCSTISNIRVLREDGKRVYYKGILMKPLWQLLNYASESLEYHYIVSRLLGENLNDISKFNDKDFIIYINSKVTPFLDIDISSKILIPRTRSEEQYIENVIPILNKRIEKIKNDYKSII